MVNDHLELQKNSGQVIYRSGKVMNGAFYIVTVSCQSDQLVIEAYDKDHDTRLALRLDLDRELRDQAAIRQSEAIEIVAKLDTHEMTAGLALVIK